MIPVVRQPGAPLTPGNNKLASHSWDRLAKPAGSLRLRLPVSFPTLEAKLIHKDTQVKCDYCGKLGERRSRHQRFCSPPSSCRELARTAIRTRVSGPTRPKQNRLKRILPAHPPKKINEFNRANYGITGPGDVIDAEVWGGRKWTPAVSSDGVEIEISHWRKRTLQ